MISYEKQKSLVAQGLATVKTEGIFDTFKYARKVMFENLWKEYPDTLYCRGHVYDNRNGKLVQNPPAKSFNYGENGTWLDVDLNSKVKAYKKYNGFMAAATLYEDQLLVSTTGTTNSDYAKLARSKIEELDTDNFFTFVTSWSTNVYEIVDESDPHIVDEKPGVYFLGDTLKDFDSSFHSEFVPFGECIETTLGELFELIKSETHEGYMVYLPSGNTKVPDRLCKIKTPYYKFKKKLMRMHSKNVEKLYVRPEEVLSEFNEYWFHIGLCITGNFPKEQWISMSDQERRKVIESIY